MTKYLQFLAATAMILLLTGCATTHSSSRFAAHISATGAWSGVFDGKTFSGTGDSLIQLGSDQPHCFSIHNDSRERLSARIEMNGYARSEWYRIDANDAVKICSDTPEGMATN